jgi:hypothetical protein
LCEGEQALHGILPNDSIRGRNSPRFVNAIMSSKSSWRAFRDTDITDGRGVSIAFPTGDREPAEG